MCNQIRRWQICPLAKTEETVKEENTYRRKPLEKSSTSKWCGRYRHTGSEEDYVIYKEALNQATVEIGNSKRSYGHKLAFSIKHVSNSFYAHVRSKQKIQDKVAPLDGSDENIIKDGCIMADHLNEYFSSVITRVDINTLPVLETKFEGIEYIRLFRITNCNLKNGS